MKKWSLPLLAIVLVFAQPARAQFAIEVSGSYNMQNGTFVAPCGCTFGKGSGIGFMGAVSMDLVSLLGFTVGLKPGYEVQQFTSQELAESTLAKMANGDKQEVKLNLLSLEPYIRYNIPKTGGLFLQVAPSIKYVLSSSFHHSAGSAAEVEGEVEINPDSAITLKSALYNAKGTLGYTVSVLGIDLEPSVSAAFPITNLSDISDAKNWAVTTLYLSLAVRL